MTTGDKTTIPANVLLTAPQSITLEPEAFQSQIIQSMSAALLRDSHPPCLLRAPTGSGKTFMLARVLANVSAEKNVLWFWFVPFVNLVAQTLDALISNSSDLAPQLFIHGRNQEAAPGQVLISTAQAVARAQWRNKDYNADGNDDTRTVAELVARARAQGLSIGMVVDEAHIALDKATEFGKFANWLAPEFLIMATATPKDQRLLDFLANAGKSDFESFTVSRDEVVNARLNKRYIEAVVYDLRQNVQDVVDLKRTVLRQAWLRNQSLKKQLVEAGVNLTPLLLVQVANGDKTVEEAAADLSQLCGVPLHAIGKHSADEPDPVLMAAIANDATKEVLIFKQSAGTGFDAPRAFVLASTKVVNDADFAMQFIGRVMRVAQAIRNHFPKTQPIPADLNTAFVYLANAEAQQGFEKAVQATSEIKNQLEGQTEKLSVTRTALGAVVYSNRATSQSPLSYDLAIPENLLTREAAVPGSPALPSRPEAQREMFGSTEGIELDEIARPALLRQAAQALKPKTEAELLAALLERKIRAYPRSTIARNLPPALKCEEKPDMAEMADLSRAVATKLELSSKLIEDAIKVAFNRLSETEIHTELTRHSRRSELVHIVTDRNALAREAQKSLQSLPQAEEEDCRIIIETVAQRLLMDVKQAFKNSEAGNVPDDRTLRRYARDAAHWVVIRESDRLAESISEEIAKQSVTIDAGPLPDAMLFPAGQPLALSAKNIYGAFPPHTDELEIIPQTLMIDEREIMDAQNWTLGNRTFRTEKYDRATSFNNEELAFAKALDRAEFVAWWHRNPDRKPYSVKLVRGEHKNFFYPDFVVCLEHYPGDEPIQRLIETKHDVKDAARKAKHVPDFYGKVLFLTKDEKRLYWVRDDGSRGNEVDLSDLDEVRTWLRESRPLQDVQERSVHGLQNSAHETEDDRTRG